jgi:pimeloyl-ACP methyl ester carboxylesterase
MPNSVLRLALTTLATLAALLAAPLGAPLGAQRVDTLRIASAAFGTTREVWVHLPEGHQYVGPEAPLPVLIVLDGQHDWFATPVRTIIQGLSDTKELPWSIIVVVPHADRVAESSFRRQSTEPLPLLRFLADELPPALTPYHASDLRVLIGHSFTASFALHALLERPDRFSAVIAHSPLDGIATTIPRVVALMRSRPDRAALVSVGGSEQWADMYHARELLPIVRSPALQPLPDNFVLHVAESARHNAVPIRATPDLLAKYFAPFANRDTLLAVNEEYVLRAPPPPVAQMMAQIDASLAFRGNRIPWQLPDIAGLASRLETGPHPAHTEAVYRRGVALYPGYFLFHASLGELVAARDPRAARVHFAEALRMLERHERGAQDYGEMREALMARLRE